MFKLHDDWRRILRHAWSIRLLGIAALLQGAEAALPAIQTVVSFPSGIFAGLSFLATGGAFATRLLAQKKFGGDNP